MTRLLLILLLALPLRAAGPFDWIGVEGPINEAAMLDAIAMVETGNRDLRGARGERGPWQLMPSVARQVGGYDRAAAARWLRVVIADMKRARIHVNPTNTALCWNGGVPTVRRGRAATSTWDYAIRVSNTYRSLLTRP